MSSVSGGRLSRFDGDLPNDPELANVSGHPVGCYCGQCSHRQLYLYSLETSTDAKIRADKRAAEDAAIPAEVNERQMAEGDHAEAVVQEHRIGDVRRKVQSTRDARLYKASQLVRESRGRMSDGDFAGFTKSITDVAALTARDRELAALHSEVRQRAVDARVVSEPSPYGPDSPYSWVLDMLAHGDDVALGRVDAGHEERLARHGQDVAEAMRKRTDYGRAAERMLTEQYRQADARMNEEQATRQRREFRALVSGNGATVSASGGQAAAFVPPAILLDAWVHYRSPFAAFVSQLDDSVALPQYGMEVVIPEWISPPSATTHAELAPVSEGDPVSGYLTGQVVEKAGMVTASQMFIDRAGGPGISGDVLLFQQLKDQLSAQVDAYALAQALAGAQQVTNAGTFALATASGEGGFLKDVKSAKSKLTDTAGVRLRATHLFAPSDFADYLAALADGQGRPIFDPARTEADPNAPEGDTGYIVSGLSMFADDNIAPSGSNTQIVVCKPSTILHLAGDVMTNAYPQGAAGNLESQVIVRQYVTTIPRYPTGVAAISGAAYLSSQFQ